MSKPIDPRESLYKATVLKHYREPAFRLSKPEQLAEARKEESRNCGDRIWLGLRNDSGFISEARFAGEGCSISVASADIACLALEGLEIKDAQIMTSEMLNFLQSLERGETRTNPFPEIADLACLESLVQYPTRVACARLVWQAANFLLV